MSLVTAHDLAVSYGAHDVFAAVGFAIPHRARIALIGPNGSGKTSLLRLIGGFDRPAAGRVHRARGLTIGYLPQVPELSGERTLYQEMRAVFGDLDRQARELRRLEEAMAAAGEGAEHEDLLARYDRLQAEFELAGGYRIEQRLDAVLTGLGFTRADHDHPLTELSGGQQTRALLARLLLESPGLLLLDEPTNHLDVGAIEWLEQFLREWDGALVAVAHDRAFLDNMADRVWELERGRLTRYVGNYSHYVQQRAERLAVQAKVYERQQAQIAHDEDYVRRNLGGQNTRMAQSRQKKLERLARVEAPTAGPQAPRVRLTTRLRGADRVLRCRDLVVGYDARRPLFSCEEAELWWRERVALLGANGSGKTTFLRTLVGEIAPLSGELRLGAGVRPGYLSQSHDRVDPGRTVIDHVLDASGMTIPEARAFLGRYRFSGDDAFKEVGTLSGGERARVALALLELQGANLLVLDEPTNHLDVYTQEMLQAVLDAFTGTILLVTHDRFLIRALGGQVWAIEGRRLWVFDQGYDEYRAWLERGGPGDVDAPGGRGEDYRAEKRAVRQVERAERRREERRAGLEETVAALEQRLADLEADLARASMAQQVEEVVALAEAHAATRAELEARMAEWLAVAEAAATAER